MPMTNEPTTGEIVSALRNCPNCDDCLRKDQKCYRNDHDAADRLESQEQTIAALTARAESAERERDAVVRCSKCKHLEVLNNETMYAICRKFGHKFRQFEADTRGTGCTQGERGQPQEGERKSNG